MPNFIVTGDWHDRSINPKARLDNYQYALREKIYEVYRLAEEYKAAAILAPGDIFDSPTVSLSTIAALARILAKAPCPVLTIPGNHDIFGHNLDSVGRTPYGFLRDLGFIQDLDNPIMDLIGGCGIVTGHGFDADTDTDQGLLQYAVPEARAKHWDFFIHVAHGMLLAKDPNNDMMRYTLIDDLAKIPVERAPHVLVCGHYHFGLPITWGGPSGKTLIINPGALGRLTAHVEEMDRTVQVALLIVNSPQDYSAKFIPLACARPGHEVLSRDHIIAAEERESRMDHFLALLAAEGTGQFLEIRDIVDDLARREKLPAAVRDEAIRRIGAAKEALAGRE